MKNLIKKMLGIKEVEGDVLQTPRLKTIFPEVKMFEEKKMLNNPMEKL